MAKATKKKVKVLIGICSARKNTAERRAVRETWLENIAKDTGFFFFVGEDGVPLEDSDDIVVFNVKDDYISLPAKIRAFFLYALEHYDFDWLCKCDDDTYLRTERIFSILPADKFAIVGDCSLEYRNAPNGGAGYFISKELVKEIVKIKNFPEYGAEDLIIGKIAVEKLGAKPISTILLNSNYGRLPMIFNDKISAHKGTPAMMREIHKLFYKAPDIIYAGKHPHWEDELYFWNEGYFIRKGSGCTGKWAQEPDGTLHLKWWNWEEEHLKKTATGFATESFVLTQIQEITCLLSKNKGSKFKNEQIPRIIHQFVSDPEKVPPLQAKCLAEWKQFSERYDFNYFLWTPETLKEFIVNAKRNDWADLISNCQDYGQYGDVCRFILLSARGGWWADWDISIIHSEKLASFMNLAHTQVTTPKERFLCTEFIGAPQNHEMINAFLAHLVTRNHDRQNTVEFAGPSGFTNFLSNNEQFCKDINILQITELFQAGYNEVYAGKRPSPDEPQPLFHFWGHVWMYEKINPAHRQTWQQANLFPTKESDPNAAPFVIAICSAQKYSDRRQACRETWIKNIPDSMSYFFFVGNSEGENELAAEDDVMQLNVPDDYEHLTKKVMAMFSDVLEKYNFEYIIKCDDDTYLVPERLSELVRNRPCVTGYVWYDGKGDLSGGGGYIIHRNCLKAIRDAMNPDEECEDVAVTKAARSLGIPILHTDRIQPGHGILPRVNNNRVSSHWCKPEDMMKIHESFALTSDELRRDNLKKEAEDTIKRENPIFTLELQNVSWKDQLRFYKNGLFSRTTGHCKGEWKLEDEGRIKLTWFDWDPEWIEKEASSAQYVFFTKSAP